MSRTVAELLQLIKYGLASAVGLAVDFGLLVLLVETATASVLTASAAGFTLGCAVVYLISRYWVFGRPRQASALQAFLLFWSIGVVGLLLNQGIMYTGAVLLGVHYVLAKTCSAGTVFLFNYALRSRMVFARKELAP